MKRTICFILLLALSLSCFACAKPAEIEASGTAKPTGDPTPEPTAEPTAEPTEEPTAEPIIESTPEPMPYELPWEKMNDYESVTVELPCVFDWETEADKEKNYDIDPFEISFILPTGWSVKDEPDENGLLDLFDRVFMLHSNQYVFDETGRCVGAFGYSLYDEPQYEGISGICGELAVPNHYQFQFHEHCIPVVEMHNTVTVLTQVFYSKRIRELSSADAAIHGDREMNNLGIISYNPEIHIYVAFEFAKDYISAIEYMDIAESLRFK